MSLRPQLTPTRLADAPPVPPGVWLLLRSALVPMVVWRRVRVLEKFQRELDVLERFLLTIAIELGSVTPADFTALLGLPERMLPILAARLERAGALAAADSGHFEETRISAAVLEAQAVTDTRQIEQTIVFLPRTADLLAVEDGRPRCLPQWLQDRQIAPTTVAPVDEKLHGLHRNMFLADAIDSGTITGLPSGVVSVASGVADTELIPARPMTAGGLDAEPLRACDAYRWSDITVPDSETAQMSLTVHGRAVGKRAQDPTYQPPRNTFRLPAAPGLVAFWEELVDEAAGPRLPDVWRAIGPRAAIPVPEVTLLVPSHWHVGLTGPAAEVLATEGRSLVHPFGMELDAEEAMPQVRIEFRPLGEAAAELFAVDEAVRLAVGDPALGIDDAIRLAVAALPAAEAAEVTAARVRDRMWQLREFAYLYRLREAKDFGYDHA